MATCARRTLYLAAALAATSLLSACATNYDSAGGRYFSVWPFVGSRSPELQLNYPAQNPKTLQLGTNPDPFYIISPQPPFDWRVESPYSQAPVAPDARLTAVGDNADCADRCESKDTYAPVTVRADAGDGRHIAIR